MLAARIEQLKTDLVGKIPLQLQKTLVGAIHRLKSRHLESLALSEGDTFPDFELPSSDGSMVSLAKLLTKGPVIINYYRGGWCPFCKIELAAYQRLMQTIAQRGNLLSISPELPRFSQSLKQAMDLGFHLLQDPHNRLAKQLGIGFTLEDGIRKVQALMGGDLPQFNGDDSWQLPMPAVYVVDSAGIVRYAWLEADYSKRAEPERVLEFM